MSHPTYPYTTGRAEMPARRPTVMVTLAPQDLSELAAHVRKLETAGVDAIGIGDSPGYHDPYVAIAAVANVAGKVGLGPMVTNVVTRHPYTTGRTLASLEALAGSGRIFAGLGAGDSAVAALGLSPATVESLRAGLGRIRSSWELANEGQAGRVAIAANGPRTLAMAAATADVVISGAGIDDESTRTFLDVINGDRGSETLLAEPWVVARVIVTKEGEDGITQLLPLLASGANHVFGLSAHLERLPEDLIWRLQRLRNTYDYQQHGRQLANANAQRVDQLGLRDFLASRFTVTGTPRQVAERFRHLAQAGVRGVVIPAVGLDVDRLIDGLAAVLTELDGTPDM